MWVLRAWKKQLKPYILHSCEMFLKAIKQWVKREGINKHRSWHKARHSFAVNILNNGADIKTVNIFLHSGLVFANRFISTTCTLSGRKVMR